MIWSLLAACFVLALIVLGTSLVPVSHKAKSSKVCLLLFVDVLVNNFFLSVRDAELKEWCWPSHIFLHLSEWEEPVLWIFFLWNSLNSQLTSITPCFELSFPFDHAEKRPLDASYKGGAHVTGQPIAAHSPFSLLVWMYYLKEYCIGRSFKWKDHW